MTVRERLVAFRLAPDGRPRPDAPFGRGPLAARVLRGAIVGAAAVVSRAPVGVVTPLAAVISRSAGSAAQNDETTPSTIAAHVSTMNDAPLW